MIAQWKNIGPKRYEARKTRGIFQIPDSEVEEYQEKLAQVIADHSAPPVPALPTMPLAMLCKQIENGETPTPMPRSRNARRKLAKRQHQERISSSLGGEAFWALIHKPISIQKAMQIDKGRAALEKEWAKLEILLINPVNPNVRHGMFLR